MLQSIRKPSWIVIQIMSRCQGMIRATLIQVKQVLLVVQSLANGRNGLETRITHQRQGFPHDSHTMPHLFTGILWEPHTDPLI